MIALLNANPDAFIGGNINLLKSGVVLRVPDAEEVRNVALSQAIAQVREQTRAWRASSAPVPQPAVADTKSFPLARVTRRRREPSPASVPGPRVTWCDSNRCRPRKPWPRATPSWPT